MTIDYPINNPFTRSTKSIADDFQRAARTVIGRLPPQRDKEWTSDETLRLLKRLHVEVVALRKDVDELMP